MQTSRRKDGEVLGGAGSSGTTDGATDPARPDGCADDLRAVVLLERAETRAGMMILLRRCVDYVMFEVIRGWVKSRSLTVESTESLRHS